MVRFWLRCLLVLGCILLGTGFSATAQTAGEEQSFLASPIAAAGRPLSLDEAVALSILNNLDVEVERFAPMIAEADRDGAWGA